MRNLLICFIISFPTICHAQLPSVINIGNFEEDIRISGWQRLAFGTSLASGDFNDDRLDDLLIGGVGWSPNEANDTGSAFIVFGMDTPGAMIEIANNSAVVSIFGDDAFDFTGSNVVAGDVNGDGIADAIVDADQNFHWEGRGMVYVIYGRTTWPKEIDLNTNGGAIPGITRVFGRRPQNFAGSALAVGDVNADGYDDVIIGAFGAGPDAGPDGEFGREGQVYIVYGSKSLGEIVKLDDYSGLTTTIWGTQDGRIGVMLGCSDVNSDGYWDVLVSQPSYGGFGGIGRIFIVFGSASLPTIIDLDDDSNASASISQIVGAQGIERIGWDFDSGDVDGDGFVDLLSGSVPVSGSGAYKAGKLRVLFGRSQWPSIVDLRTDSNTLTINGVNFGDALGYRVKIGDFNGDGFADILGGAPFAEIDGLDRTGKVFLIYGSDSLREKVELNLRDELDSSVQILGFQPGQELGIALGSADFNRDGVDDLVVAAPGADSKPFNQSGEVYVIYGRKKDDDLIVPSSARLLQNYPNPFNASTVIRYQLDQTQTITIKIYNSLGQQIRTLVNGRIEAGEHRAIWNGYSDSLSIAGSGVYFVRLSGDSFVQSRKILLLK